MVIDSHHHFWCYRAAEYDWISDDMACIRRDFLPADLHHALRQAGVEGAITVQARQSMEETHWLLEMARQHVFIRGVVGWLPLAKDGFDVPGDPKLVGVRHVVQAEAPGFLDDAAFNRGIARLAEHDLVYDILIVEHQLVEAIRFVDRHPRQVFVLDHIAKPRIRDGMMEPWRTNLRELARRENVCCKLSGMVTEADFRLWTEAALRRYYDVVLEAFGPGRLMFGSDWPVRLAACEYARWVEIVKRWVGTGADAERIMGGTAERVYLQ